MKKVFAIFFVVTLFGSCCIFMPAPEMPTGLGYIVSAEGYTFYWDDVANESGYYFSIETADSIVFEETLGKNENSISPGIDFEPGSYTANIFAFNNCSDSATASLDFVVEEEPPVVTIPVAPTFNTEFATATETSVVINWNDNSDNETGFKLWVRETEDFSGDPDYTLGANVESCDVGALDAGTYYVKLLAYNLAGDSATATDNFTIVAENPGIATLLTTTITDGIYDGQNVEYALDATDYPAHPAFAVYRGPGFPDPTGTYSASGTYTNSAGGSGSNSYTITFSNLREEEGLIDITIGTNNYNDCPISGNGNRFTIWLDYPFSTDNVGRMFSGIIPSAGTINITTLALRISGSIFPDWEHGTYTYITP